MTERMIAAMEHPLIDCIGHLTGRLLLRREPYGVDIERIVEAAARTGTMMEINGNPNRRDLNEGHAKLAAEAGVTIVCNTDAHGVDTLDNMQYSVATARRAWLTPEQIANTRPWRSFAPLRKRAGRSASGDRRGSFALPGERSPSSTISRSRGQRHAGVIWPARVACVIRPRPQAIIGMSSTVSVLAELARALGALHELVAELVERPGRSAAGAHQVGPRGHHLAEPAVVRPGARPRSG